MHASDCIRWTAEFSLRPRRCCGPSGGVPLDSRRPKCQYGQLANCLGLHSLRVPEYLYDGRVTFVDGSHMHGHGCRQMTAMQDFAIRRIA
jgi:hypothetical protein